MEQINNVVSKSNYEAALDSIESTCPGWEIRRPSGELEKIGKKICKSIDDGACYVFPFKHTYISNRLKFPHIKLSPQNPIFIDAQTGSGKTSFIFEKVYQYTRSIGKKLLVLVSRSALKTKVKYDAIEAAGTEQKNDLTPSGIEKEHHFGDIDVYSYQDFCIGSSLHTHQKDINWEEYGVIVFDECHFFLADADFNPFTESIFHYLVEAAYKNYIPRIYLTGTASCVFDSILEKEKSLWERSMLYNFPLQHSSFYMNFYYFERDYSYIQLMSFKKDNSVLCHYIQNSDNVKWLIFVDSKEFGHRLYSRLIELGKDVCFLSSEELHVKNSSAEFLSDLTDRETLSCDVLITTKCLDVGITIRDKDINIVNFLHDKVDFLQSIGRKRISGPETVNLLIPEYTISDVKRWLKQANYRKIKFTESCRNCPEHVIANGCSVEQPVYIEHGKYRHNHFAFLKLNSQIRQLEDLIEKIKLSDKPDTEIIMNYFASWMKGCHLQIQVPNNSDNSRILEIIEKYRIAPMTQEQFDSLTEELREYDPRSDQRASREKLTTQTINRILSPLGLCINRSYSKTNPSYSIVPKEEN